MLFVTLSYDRLLVEKIAREETDCVLLTDYVTIMTSSSKKIFTHV